MRFVTVFLAAGLVALAVVIYQVKYETGGLQKRVTSLRKQIRDERETIAILRAEWSYLNRPERLDRLARKHLGLEPVRARQIVTLDKLATLPVRSNRTGDLERPAPASARRQPVSLDR